MNSESIKSCPRCSEPIPAEAPQGLCPKCLLAFASAPAEPRSSAEGSKPPSLETIAAGFPHLEILEFIGQGGMGLVFKARQPKLDRLVALKLLPQKPGADPSFCERFNREARVLARLSHPNIVAVHDFGEAGPFFYLLMEYVDGVNLRQAMKAGRFTPAQALALVPKICDALQYAHEEGVLHRDIKPENLLLDTRGRVKIADFGIAKLLGEPRDITLTAQGAAVGTPHYMAPEQLERPHDVDQRADVYSLGVVFYEMLTGELPIGRFAPPSEKAAIDPRVDQVVLRTLEKERERRFQSAGDVKTQVENITNTSGSAPGPTSAFKNPSTDVPPVLPDRSEPGQPGQAAMHLGSFVGTGLVLFSLLGLALAILGGVRIGPETIPVLFILIGLPALAGTLLAWLSLHKLRTQPSHRLRGKLALLSAVAWPLLVLDVVTLLVLVLGIKGVFMAVFHGRAPGFLEAVAVFGSLIILGLDCYVVWKWVGRWEAKRALPGTELFALLRGVPRRAIWVSGAALVVFVSILLIVNGRGNAVDPSGQTIQVQEPQGPPGYEVAPGAPPGEGRVYRSNVTVPPGYRLSVVPVLLSNQTVMVPGVSNLSLGLLAPEGLPVHGQLAWRLLGNSTWADGAPLQVSLSLPQSADHVEKSFHVVPPQPVIVDWVGEPAQVWPPQNGRTRFLVMKGTPGDATSANTFPAEWAFGIETRLDPIPEDILSHLKAPTIDLGTNRSNLLENTQESAVESTGLQPQSQEPGE